MRHREQLSCYLCGWKSGWTPLRRWHWVGRIDRLILDVRWECHTRTHNHGGWWRELTPRWLRWLGDAYGWRLVRRFLTALLAALAILLLVKAPIPTMLGLACVLGVWACITEGGTR